MGNNRKGNQNEHEKPNMESRNLCGSNRGKCYGVLVIVW